MKPLEENDPLCKEVCEEEPNVGKVKELISDKKVSFNINGRIGNTRQTLLLGAALNNKTPEVVDVLLEGGAPTYAQAKGDWTPLFCAVYNKHQSLEMVQMLLKVMKLADINAKARKGWTALNQAEAIKKDSDIVKALKKAGAK